MYKYRLYPSRKQQKELINQFSTCKTIYNEFLALSIDSYRFGNVTLNKFDYNKYLTGKYTNIYSQVKQNISDRVHKSFQNFFRRVKENSKKKGFPRFKSRINSITYPQSGFKFINDKRLYVSKIGNIPIILHRIPKGEIKTMTIKQNKANQWFAIFSCEVPDTKVKHPSKDKIGIDVGIENFATLSNGEFINNPRFLIKSEKRLKFLQRRLSRKKKGSNRRKAKFRLAKQHIKVSNQRTDFLHKITNKITKSYSFIAIEELNIKNMIKNHHLAKHINDASWNNFFSMLSYKAVICGGQVIENPRTRGSSHRCSKCGTNVDMPLSKRELKCYKCLNILHRDHNSAINHLKDTAGLAEIYTPVEILPLPIRNYVSYHPPFIILDKASEVIEAGTICDELLQKQ